MTAMAGRHRDRIPSRETVTLLFAAAVAVSIVHYVDNVVAYDSFPADGPLPDPPRWLIGAAWFVFTAAGIAGIAAYRRGDLQRAAVLLAVYSGSGLVGIGHYTVPGALDMPWWRHAHVIADIACGVAILFVALAAARAPRERGSG